MKKIKYFIAIILLFMIFNNNVLANDEWLCKDCGNGIKTWTNKYTEDSSICYNSINSSGCTDSYDTKDMKIQCTYKINTVHIYDEYTGDYIGEYEETEDFFSEIFNGIETLTITFENEKLNVIIGDSNNTDYEDSGKIPPKTIIEKDFYDSINKKFYCPKYVYGDNFNYGSGIEVLSGSKEVRVSDIDTGRVYSNKEEYQLISSSSNESMNKYGCYNCSNGLIWTNTPDSTCSLDSTKKEQNSCIENDAKCYNICENWDKEDKKYYCYESFKIYTSTPNKSDNKESVSGDTIKKYSLLSQESMQKCRRNINETKLDSCGTYHKSNFDLSVSSIQVFKSKDGAYVYDNGEYIYLRRSKPDECPIYIFHYEFAFQLPSVSDEYQGYAGDDYYYVASDMTYWHQNYKRCVSDGNSICEVYEKAVSKSELDDLKKEKEKQELSYECMVDHSLDVACGSVFFIPREIPFLTNLIMNLIKIVTPIVLIIKGSIDLIKAMTGGNEQEIAKSRSKFFKRLIPAVLVFLIILVVQFIFGLFATDSESNTFFACSNCFLNGKCSSIPNDLLDNYCDDLQISENTKSDNHTTNPGGNSGQGGTTNPGGNTTTNITQLRQKVYDVAYNAYNNKQQFIYLEPSERDLGTITNISNLGAVNGGSCKSKTYNNEKCITYEGKQYYGTDCNGFISYVYHNALGYTTGTYKFFYPDTGSKVWKFDSGSDKYFNNYIYDDINTLKNAAEMGDAVARVCGPDSSSNYSTHIAIYAGSGNIIDNNGWITSKDKRMNPIKLRNIKDFVNGKTNCKFTLFKLKG